MNVSSLWTRSINKFPNFAHSIFSHKKSANSIKGMTTLQLVGGLKVQKLMVMWGCREVKLNIQFRKIQTRTFIAENKQIFGGYFSTTVPPNKSAQKRNFGGLSLKPKNLPWDKIRKILFTAALGNAPKFHVSKNSVIASTVRKWSELLVIKFGD